MAMLSLLNIRGKFSLNILVVLVSIIVVIHCCHIIETPFLSTQNEVDEIQANEEKADLTDLSGVLTNHMIKEEQQLHEESVKEDEKIKEQRKKLMKEMTKGLKEDRFRRLQFLLTKSNMYTQYLLERMERQKQETRKRQERKEKRLKQKEEEEKALREKDDLTENKRDTRKRQKDDGPDSKKGTSSKKGKKRMMSKSDEPNPDEQASKKQKISQGESLDKENITDNRSSPEKKDPVNAQGDASSLVSSAEEEMATVEDASLYVEKKKMINGEIVSADQPLLFSGGVLRSYQIEGYKWMSVLYENGVNGILADEMGLGKTVQCIAVIAHLTLMEVGGPYLIVGPLSTLPNWFAEFKRFTPKLPVVFYHGTKDERCTIRRQIRRSSSVTSKINSQPSVITSYEIAMRDRKLLQNFEWKYLIVDEGHRIKNANCRLIQELKMYNTTHRLLLTGTPLQNNLSELWSLLNFLLPEIFDDLGSFEAWFDVELISGENSDEKLVADQQRQDVLSMLHQILTPFLLRRLKSDVDLCIPPKREVLVYAPMSKSQEEYYSALVSRTILQLIQKKKVIEEKVEELPEGRPVRRASKKKINYKIFMEDNKDAAETPSKKRRVTEEDPDEELNNWMKAILENEPEKPKKETKAANYSSQVCVKMANIMMMLRKCCNHPYLLEYPLLEDGDYRIDEDVIKASGKLLLVDRMLLELKKRGHKVLLFSQMTKMLDILEDFCYLRKIKYCRLDGSCKLEDRREQIDDFNKDPEKFLFLISTRAGGLGLNLVAADTVIIYDSDWNPQCDLQAQDRCHRIGQTRPVVVYRMVTTNTIDQRIVERAAAKRKLEKIIIHKGKFKSGMKDFSTHIVPMTPQELLSLLNSKDHQGVVGGEGEVISDDDLQKLLDRSDLEASWKKQQQLRNSDHKGAIESSPEKSTKSPEDTCSLFKVIDSENGRIGVENKGSV